MSDTMRSVFQLVNVYEVKTVCRTPLHVGSAKGENGEILIHPVSGEPFIQASGIAGAFRDYTAAFISAEAADDWFGDKDKTDGRSRIVFTDGVFSKGNFKMELRTRVSIDPKTGTTAAAEGKSGQLLKTEYISAGSEVFFKIYEYCKSKDEETILRKCLKALDSGSILLGGQLSNGCGQFELIKVNWISCDMFTEKGRENWGNLAKAEYVDICDEIRKVEIGNESNLEFSMQVVFDEAILVKGDQVSQKVIEETTGIRFQDGERLPDKMQLMDGSNRFIIPGSSTKGVFRNHMEKIMKYCGLDAESNKEEKSLGDKIFEDRSHLFFYDSFIGGGMNLQVRTRIDKFTGSVMDKALFKEAVNGGSNAESTIRIRLYKKNLSEAEMKKITALVFMTMRDCAIGIVNLGSGYNVGRGFMTVNSMSLSDGETKLAELQIRKNADKNTYECTGTGMDYITSCLNALKQGEVS